MASRLRDCGKPAATASRPLTPAAAGKENSASMPSKPTSAVRWSTSSIPRASRIPSSVDSSKLVSTLRASAMPGRASIGKDMEAEAGLRRSVSGGIRAAPERARRSVSGVGTKAPDARRASSVPRADEIGRRNGFDARAKGIDETSGKRESYDAKAKHISVKRKSFDANVVKKCVEIKGKREGFDTNAKKQRDGIGGEKVALYVKNRPGEASSKATSITATEKDGDGGNNAVIPVFTAHVVDSNDFPCRVREEQKSTKESRRQEEKGKLADKIRVFEQASVSGEGRSMKSVCGLNKYPSKLHEKLAALEGRVQKIATDIKKTKEMLDENNPDEPKQILSNIQREITAIEKAISHVKDDNKLQLGTVDSSDCESSHAKKDAKCAVTKPSDLKPAKGMNTDELEARFFPHHKLLRDRINRKMEHPSFDPQEDETSIAMEFLASLDGEETDFFKDCKARNLEKNIICEAADASIKPSGQGSSNNLVGPNHEMEIELLATEKLEDREAKAFHVEQDICHTSSVPSCRTVLGPLPNVGSSRSSSAISIVERQQWWYRPCGPLLLFAASKQKMVTAYDIRDGDIVMKWEVDNPILGMEYSSPLQWRSRGKVVVAGTESLGLWDVNSLNPQPLLSVAFTGKKLYCLHVNNSDAEVGGGVRQRVSSSEVEGNDGVFSTQESVNIFDFRVPAGIGLKIARHDGTANSIFSRGDSIFIGSTEGRLQIRGVKSRVQHYSLRKGKLVATYELPDFNAHIHHSSITQVWGNSNIVFAACGMGLFAFDTFNEDVQQTYSCDRGATIGVREAIGSDDLYSPTFDYSLSRVLLVSRDRPAHWRYLS
ncbi:hypothetical protein GUJ93_ZPchr0002g26467 [Zizania palustris]|uniref:At4g14310 8-bladed propeller domain-containing protein n=1 Tax=Zizania palustris TaxID=103762 RepID=A0A8J5SE75_ZIZPA|nr:hypothetical protein GUJ93_ZPchr0002g26467 [Zizania palustris]